MSKCKNCTEDCKLAGTDGLVVLSVRKAKPRIIQWFIDLFSRRAVNVSLIECKAKKEDNDGIQ
jgi:hypothetical protein